MDGESVRNTCYLSGLLPISDFFRYIFSVPASSLPTSPSKLFHVGTEILSASFADSVFGSVPSTNEVEYAVAALQSFMQRRSGSKSSDNNQRRLQSPVLQRVDDAFHLLQTLPSVLKMVVSISSDTAVWDAVMKNNEIREFQRSLKQAILRRPPGFDASDTESEYMSVILWWMLDNMKLTLTGLIDTLKSLVTDTDTVTEPKVQYEELICSTVLLSTLALIIVIVTRTYGA